MVGRDDNLNVTQSILDAGEGAVLMETLSKVEAGEGGELTEDVSEICVRRRALRWWPAMAA